MNKLFKNVMGWVDARFPATETYEYQDRKSTRLNSSH